MRRVNIQDLKLGMVIARPIYSSDGRILLQTGISLDEEYIRRLKEMGITSIYIRDKFLDEVDDIPDVVSEKTRIAATKLIGDNFKQLEKQHKINTRAITNMVNNIIDELLSNSKILVHLSDIRAFDDYTFAHSVNVCILSIMTGITLGYNELKLKELGLGALLHDVGKIKIDKKILNKPGDLTKEEFNEVKNHTEYGFEILRKYDDIPLLSAHIAYQHHERWDGNGYPRGLAGRNIHEYARIVAVADVYDALLDYRPYRPSYTVTQAITIIKRMAGIYLDTSCVSSLIANIAVYPIGSIIELNSGEIGVVVDVNKETPTKPVVKILYNRNQKRISHPYEVDLSKFSTVVVAKSLSEEEISRLRNNSP